MDGVVEGDGVIVNEGAGLLLQGEGHAQRSVGEGVGFLQCGAFELLSEPFLQDIQALLNGELDDVLAPDVLPEGEQGLNVLPLGDVAFAVLIAPDAHIGDGRFVANVLLEGLELHLLRAPPRNGRREVVAIRGKEVVEGVVDGGIALLEAVVAFDGFAEDGF